MYHSVITRFWHLTRFYFLPCMLSILYTLNYLQSSPHTSQSMPQPLPACIQRPAILLLREPMGPQAALGKQIKPFNSTKLCIRAHIIYIYIHIYIYIYIYIYIHIFISHIEFCSMPESCLLPWESWNRGYDSTRVRQRTRASSPSVPAGTTGLHQTQRRLSDFSLSDLSGA